MKVTRLGDIFTEEQLKRVIELFKESQQGCADFDITKASSTLLPYFKEIEADLKAKGLLPEYAAYAVPYFMHQQCVAHEKTKRFAQTFRAQSLSGFYNN